MVSLQHWGFQWHYSREVCICQNTNLYRLWCPKIRWSFNEKMEIHICKYNFRYLKFLVVIIWVFDAPFRSLWEARILKPRPLVPPLVWNTIVIIIPLEKYGPTLIIEESPQNFAVRFPLSPTFKTYSWSHSHLNRHLIITILWLRWYHCSIEVFNDIIQERYAFVKIRTYIGSDVLKSDDHLMRKWKYIYVNITSDIWSF